MKIIVPLVGVLFVFSVLSVNVQASACNCEKASFAKLPEGVKSTDVDFFENGGYDKFLADLDAKHGEGYSEKYASGTHLTQHCGSELNKLSGNTACPENAVVSCRSDGENGGTLHDDADGGISKCGKKCKLDPQDEWRRICA